MADHDREQDQQAIDRVGKWVRLALAASLGMNIFLGGFVAARLLGPKPPVAPLPVVDLSLRGLPQGLPREVREDLENSIRSYRREIRTAYRDHHEQQRAIKELLAAEQLNEVALIGANRQLRALNSQIQGIMQGALVDVFREMDVETRRQVIQLRQIPRIRRFGRPQSVDGTRWRFEWRDEDGFQLRMGDDAHMIMEFHTEEDVPAPETEEEPDQ